MSIRALLAAIALFFMPMAGLSAEIPTTDKAEFQRIIDEQISAFRMDNGVAAYSHAAPIIKQIFPTPEAFMGMVKQGYPQVYRPQSYKFEEAVLNEVGRPTQKVTLVGPDGKTWQALYTMEKQADGTWQIAGCVILEVPGLDV